MHYNPRDRNTSHCKWNKALLLLQGAGHDCREEVRPLFTGIARVERLARAMQAVEHQEQALQATQEQLPRMGGCKISSLALIGPRPLASLSPTLSRRERGLTGQQ